MNGLNIFKFDEDYEDTEEKYKILKKEILDETDSDEDGSDGEESGSGETDSEEDEEGEEKKAIHLVFQSYYIANSFLV